MWRSISSRYSVTSFLTTPVSSSTGGKTPPYLSENGFSRFLLFMACGGKTLSYSRKRFRRFLFLRQVFPYSQKAGFLRGARFARNNTDIYVTTEFFREFVLLVLNTFIKKKMVLFKFYLPNEIRKILILRKARGAVKRRKNKQSLLWANSRLPEPKQAFTNFFQ